MFIYFFKLFVLKRKCFKIFKAFWSWAEIYCIKNLIIRTPFIWIDIRKKKYIFKRRNFLKRKLYVFVRKNSISLKLLFKLMLKRVFNWNFRILWIILSRYFPNFRETGFRYSHILRKLRAEAEAFSGIRCRRQCGASNKKIRRINFHCFCP